MKIITLYDWFIVELTHFIMVGTTSYKSLLFTDEIHLIKENYVVTQSGIYALSDPDKLWMAIPESALKIKMFL